MSAEASTATKLVAEGLGTFLLVFTVGCNVLTSSGSWAGVSIGGVLMVSIYALGGVSGGHFNPAVSIGLGFSKAFGGPGIAWKDALLYVVAQLATGAVAGFACGALLGEPLELQVAAGFHLWQAALVELIYTAVLVFTVLNVALASRDKGNGYYGLAIGFVVVAGATGAGAISMGCFNPAVAVALGVTSLAGGATLCLIYTAFELSGALLATGLFALVRPEDFSTRPVPSLLAGFLSEFLGTFVLVLTVGLNILAGSSAGAFAISASLTSMVYALGSVSGGHFNPAVSTAVLLFRVHLSLKELVSFLGRLLAQLAGGVLAGLLYVGLYLGQEQSSFPLGPGDGYTLGQAVIMEGIFTFVLAFVVLSVAVAEQTKSAHFFGLAIGFCVVAGGTAAGKVSGGAFNPAVSFGVAAGHALSSGSLLNALLYTLVQLLAGCCAAGVAALIHGTAPAAAAQGTAELPSSIDKLPAWCRACCLHGGQALSELF